MASLRERAFYKTTLYFLFWEEGTVATGVPRIRSTVAIYSAMFLIPHVSFFHEFCSRFTRKPHTLFLTTITKMPLITNNIPDRFQVWFKKRTRKCEKQDGRCLNSRNTESMLFTAFFVSQNARILQTVKNVPCSGLTWTIATVHRIIEAWQRWSQKFKNSMDEYVYTTTNKQAFHWETDNCFDVLL